MSSSEVCRWALAVWLVGPVKLSETRGWVLHPLCPVAGADVAPSAMWLVVRRIWCHHHQYGVICEWICNQSKVLLLFHLQCGDRIQAEAQAEVRH